MCESEVGLWPALRFASRLPRESAQVWVDDRLWAVSLLTTTLIIVTPTTIIRAEEAFDERICRALFFYILLWNLRPKMQTLSGHYLFYFQQCFKVGFDSHDDHHFFLLNQWDNCYDEWVNHYRCAILSPSRPHVKHMFLPAAQQAAGLQAAFHHLHQQSSKSLKID